MEQVPKRILPNGDLMVVVYPMKKISVKISPEKISVNEDLFTANVWSNQHQTFWDRSFNVAGNHVILIASQLTQYGEI